MNFVEKKNLHDRLLGVTHLEADRELLSKVAPAHNVLKKGIFNPVQAASEILWALLDYCSAEEITQNRREKSLSVRKQAKPSKPETSGSKPEIGKKRDPEVIPEKKSGKKKSTRK